jgi:hypothetical protein
MKLTKRQVEILELINRGNGEILEYTNGSGEVRLKSKWASGVLFNCYTVGGMICFWITKKTFQSLLKSGMIIEKAKPDILFVISDKGRQYLREAIK